VPFCAVNVTLYVLLVPAAGVPLNFAVPFPLFTKVTPEGSAPDSVIVGEGVPAVVMLNVPAVPTLNAVFAALVIAGPALAVSVKVWVALGEMPLAAVILRLELPLDEMVPASVAVPLWLSVNVTPLGVVPDLVNVGTGKPVATNVNDPGDLVWKMVLAGLVIVGTWFTVRVNDWTAFGSVPFCAVIVSGYVPAVPAAGVPLSFADVPLATKVTPAGSAPNAVITGVGVPVTLTVNEPDEPTLNAVLLAVLMTGAWLTVIAKLCDAFGVVPFDADKVLVNTPLAVGVPANVPVPL
jgi:hypothetical protein